MFLVTLTTIQRVELMLRMPEHLTLKLCNGHASSVSHSIATQWPLNVCMTFLLHYDDDRLAGRVGTPNHCPIHMTCLYSAEHSLFKIWVVGLIFFSCSLSIMTWYIRPNHLSRKSAAHWLNQYVLCNVSNSTIMYNDFIYMTSRQTL